ncbi:MAG: MauE/DoxX family redox-associated membrane protein [Mycobacteriales bacterium]
MAPADLIGVVAQVVLAGVLGLAALGKLSRPGEFRQVIRRLGAGPAVAGVAAGGVIVAEAVATCGLVAAPSAWWPRAVVAVLAAGFAGAGAVALATRTSVACRCFGAAGNARLGWHQVWLLPAWWAAAGLAQAYPPGWSARTGLAGLAAGLLLASGWRLRREWALSRELRGDRLIVRELAPDEEAHAEVTS